jgi:hypothetical protein
LAERACFLFGGLDAAQETVRNIGVSVGEEPCCISPLILKPWRS